MQATQLKLVGPGREHFSPHLLFLSFAKKMEVLL